jgi:hypothetical protein
VHLNILRLHEYIFVALVGWQQINSFTLILTLKGKGSEACGNRIISRNRDQNDRIVTFFLFEQSEVSFSSKAYYSM